MSDSWQPAATHNCRRADILHSRVRRKRNTTTDLKVGHYTSKPKRTGKNACATKPKRKAIPRWERFLAPRTALGMTCVVNRNVAVRALT